MLRRSGIILWFGCPGARLTGRRADVDCSALIDNSAALKALTVKLAAARRELSRLIYMAGT